ncbi:competence protein CoiA [Salinicoccus sp. HZC-1]|uniref:competence protein CoiA n=1 Tax=Salinicoccus sp. HZC-1 TaxID=3385497 RepID=UPI00398B0DEA
MDCTHYLHKNESIGHLRSKQELYSELADIAPVAMEHYLPEIEQIPDLLIDGRLALEIQFSTISAELIAERSKGYHSLGMEVIWLLDEAAVRTDKGKCIPSRFQLSTMYRGSLFTYDPETKKFTGSYCITNTAAADGRIKKRRYLSEHYLRCKKCGLQPK